MSIECSWPRIGGTRFCLPNRVLCYPCLVSRASASSQVAGSFDAVLQVLSKHLRLGRKKWWDPLRPKYKSISIGSGWGKDPKEWNFWDYYYPLSQFIRLFTQEIVQEKQQATYPPLKGVVLVIPLYQASSLLDSQEDRAGDINMYSFYRWRNWGSYPAPGVIQLLNARAGT